MRAVRLFVNWFFVLTSPIWILPSFILAILITAKDGTKYRKAWMSGEIWIGDDQ